MLSTIRSVRSEYAFRGPTVLKWRRTAGAKDMPSRRYISAGRMLVSPTIAVRTATPNRSRLFGVASYVLCLWIGLPAMQLLNRAVDGFVELKYSKLSTRLQLQGEAITRRNSMGSIGSMMSNGSRHSTMSMSSSGRHIRQLAIVFHDERGMLVSCNHRIMLMIDRL